MPMGAELRGVDGDQIVVEESTEPPICGSAHATATTPNPPIQAPPPAERDNEKSASLVPHTLAVADLERLLQTSAEDGLSHDEASRRLAQDGPNEVKGAKGLSVWKILLRQVSNSLTMVLVLVMAISFAIQDYIEGGVISAVILLNIIVGFVQDYRAEQTIQSLCALSAPTCKVIRSQKIETIKAESLVKGDVVLLAVGDVVPADLRLVSGLNLSTDEALLTGESLPISKHPDAVLQDAEIPLGDRVNMVYSASTITRGRGTGIVTATAMDTEVGKIASMLRANPKPQEDVSRLTALWIRMKNGVRSILGLDGTPLQVQLSKFALMLFAFAIILAVIVFSASRWQLDDDVLIYGICVGVAVIPESLIAVLTISMAVGTKAMARGNVIVRKLAALEAVGGVTNICSDKTGTLTQGKMITKKVWLRDGSTATVDACIHAFDPSNGQVTWSGNEGSSAVDSVETFQQVPKSAKTFIECMSLCGNAIVTDGKPMPSDDSAETTTVSSTSEPRWTAVGEPTEIALQVFSMRFGMGKQSVTQTNGSHLVAEHPFDSSCKRMTVLYTVAGSCEVDVYTKGAVEALMPLLDSSEEEKANMVAQAEALAGEGLRVLCIAHKSVPYGEGLKAERAVAESNLKFLGLAGLYDPPRLETADAVKKCRVAGISVHMLTGDHIKTATAIAHDVGILGTDLTAAEAANATMLAATFDALDDAAIDEIPHLPLVLARCSPATKVRMVEAMHRRGAFCVMTGDGVNDSPALKKADVGIAMGLNGSDVAKEAADMVLTDDNFASIVTAVEEGRRLFDNIQKFLLHLLVSNIGQVILLLIGLAFKDPGGGLVFPLSPIEILWANLITSSFLALGLGLEEAQPDIMQRRPHDLAVGVFTSEIIIDKLVYGFAMGALCIASFASVAYAPAPLNSCHLGETCNRGYDAAVTGHPDTCPGYYAGPTTTTTTNNNKVYNEGCDGMLRARAATFAALSLMLLATAWEVKHLTRSLFATYPGGGGVGVARTVWRNRFLFFAVLAGFLVTFPVVYIPVLNRRAFKHAAISWEWGVVVAAVLVYGAVVEGVWTGFVETARLSTQVPYNVPR
ncbi:potassium/sodium eff [Xylariomycetidae sp. FL0641]|nr:potassium/sodium eff [Xylariomycetidae sp. FL0641]